MDIYPENSFFSVNVIEGDENIPSIKFNLQVNINQFQSSFL